MTIRVKVYAPGFINHDSIDPSGFVKLAEGSSVIDLFQQLKISPILRRIMLCTVNYEKSPLNTILKDGDVVSFLFPFPGG